MTEKQERIIQSALRLFATQGYASTSTNKVAQEAGVSEGLIFRHFGNKEGLLDAVMEQCAEATRKVLSDVVLTAEPAEVIRKLLDLPFSIPQEEYEMWRLTYALKWQTDRYDQSSQEPLKVVLRKAFSKLGYDDPTAETELILMYLHGAATSLLLYEPQRKSDILIALKKKYALE